MSEKRNELTDEQIEEVVKQSIIKFKKEQGIIKISENSNFRGWLGRKAWELGYIQNMDAFTRLNVIKCIEKVWSYVEEGILAPGSIIKDNENRFNSLFFPYLHLTEKGKKEMLRW